MALTQNEIALGVLINAAIEKSEITDLLANLTEAIAFLIAGYRDLDVRQGMANDIAGTLGPLVEEYRNEMQEDKCDDPECPVHGVRH